MKTRQQEIAQPLLFSRIDAGLRLVVILYVTAR